MNPYSCYEERIRVYKEEENAQKSKSKWFLLLKLLSFCGSAWFVYASFKDPAAGNIIIATVCAVMYLMFYIIDDKCIKRIDYIRHKQQVCRDEQGYLKGNFAPFDKGERYVDMQHEYAFDLDIFGEHSLYHRICRAVTSQGADRLAALLTNIAVSKSEIVERQQAVNELKGMEEWRIGFLARPKTRCQLGLLADLAKEERYNGIMLRTVLPYFVVGITCITLALGLWGLLPMGVFGIAFFLQLFITNAVRKPMKQASIHLTKLYKEFSGYVTLLDTIRQTDFKSEVMLRVTDTLFRQQPNSTEAFGELERLLNQYNMRNNELMNALLNGIFLFDVFWTRRFARWSRCYLDFIDDWVTCIAEIDAYVSMATYAFNTPYNHQAQIVDEDSDIVLKARNIYHPFLVRDVAVPNDFALTKGKVSIVTGANMAGKSTFLRTIGVSYVMACCGMPVCAEELQMSIVSLFSSMRTSDNLSDNISYFNAELIRLKQLLHHAKSHRFTLIILDEILKGTNSKDKLEGSILFLNEITKLNVSALIATHDLELAKMEETDGNIYSNYCFEIALTDDIQYSYKIKRGVVENLNASYLLRKFLLVE